MLSLAAAGKLAWLLMVAAWYAIRRPFQRRARRSAIVEDRLLLPERIRLGISLTGLGIIPAIYAATGQPRFAAYSPHPAQIVLGIAAAILAAVLFRLTHKALGANWSVSLQLKRQHRLVTGGIYRYLRHPMYSAFWLMAVAQALLLANWIAGPAGLAGFGTLFLLRLRPEEEMMERAFGEDYARYKARTKRIVPFVY